MCHMPKNQPLNTSSRCGIECCKFIQPEVDNSNFPNGGISSMSIPTEPIGSIPRPPALIEGMREFAGGNLSRRELDSLFDAAVVDTIQRFEATGSPVITDGEQRKGSFATYPVEGLENLAPDG